jgi:hypothetical protein
LKVVLGFMQRSPKDHMFFFGFEYLLQLGWIVTNHNLSKYLASNNNSHKSPTINLLNSFRREIFLYFRVLARFFCV